MTFPILKIHKPLGLVVKFIDTNVGIVVIQGTYIKPKDHYSTSWASYKSDVWEPYILSNKLKLLNSIKEFL